MKKIFFTAFLLVIAVTTLFGQVYTNNIDSKLKFINSSLLKSGGTDNNNVPTGKLYDRAYPLAQLHEFNGTYADTSSATIFYQAYSEIIQSAYNSTGLKTVEQLDNIANSIKNGSRNIIPVGILNQDFNYLDPDALEKNSLSLVGEDLYRGSNTSISPFILKKLVMLSPLSSVVPQIVQFNFTNELVFQQSSSAIGKIEADFADGMGYRVINIPQTITVSYSTKGLKIIHFRVTFLDGSIVLTNAALYSDNAYIPTTSSDANMTAYKLQANIPFQGYDEASPNKGIGDVQTFFGNNNSTGKVKKPIIVLDGFDPLDTRGTTAIYNMFNRVEDGSLASQLRGENYDIVILNFPKYKNEQGKEIDGGTDYIERNAMVLVSLLQKINLEKPSNEQSIVIGPSMGGLISRYALAFMEKMEAKATTPEDKIKWNHQVRLWISFDSPHNGANIPAGLQKLVSRLADIGVASAKDSRDIQLRSVAAKQMLISHFDANSENLIGAPSFRDKFANALKDDIGYPQNLRKIAVANGSLNATLTNTPADKIFTLEVTYKKQLLFWRIKTVTALTARPYFTSGYGGRSKILDINLMGGLDNTDTYITSNQNSQSLDNSPGGTYYTAKVISDSRGEMSIFFDHNKFGGFLSNVLFGSVKTSFYSLKENHCFIPLKSALGFTGSNIDLAESVYNRDLVASKETPFDSYYGPIDKNMEHVSLDKDMVQYVLDEIHGIKRDPRTSKNDMKDAEILGPKVLCNANTGLFTLDKIPQVTGITWTKSPNLNFVGSSTGSSVTVQPTTTSVEAWVEATVTYHGQDFKVPRNTFWVGAIKPILTQSPVSDENQELTVTASTNPKYLVDYLSNYTWTITDNNGNTYTQTTQKPSITFDHYVFNVKLAANTPCGIVTSNIKIRIIDSYTLSIYPNPTTKSFSVNLNQPEQGIAAFRTATADAKSLTVLIYNGKNQVEKQQKVIANQPIDVSNFREGYYIVHVIDGATVYKEKLLIRR